MSLLSDVANVVQIAGVPLALLALGLGLKQLQQADKQLDKAGKTARVQVLLALDESLSRFEDVRADLNDKKLNIEDNDTRVRLRRYIGAFERVGYALRVGEITLDLVDHFYGDRFKNLARYIDTNKRAKQIIEHEAGWKDFYYL